MFVLQIGQVGKHLLTDVCGRKKKQYVHCPIKKAGELSCSLHPKCNDISAKLLFESSACPELKKLILELNTLTVKSSDVHMKR